jgi:hypothetical protein
MSRSAATHGPVYAEWVSAWPIFAEISGNDEASRLFRSIVVSSKAQGAEETAGSRRW